MSARVIAAIAALLLLVGATLWWPRTVDDAYISLRYAENLVAGHGPVFNPGERVEGYTNPSWVALAAGALLLGVDPVPVVKIAGVAVSLALLALLWRALRRASISPPAAGGATLLLGSSYVLAIWSVAGLETNFYALLLFGGLCAVARHDGSAGSTARVSGWFAAAALTRPEGLAFWLLGCAWCLRGIPPRRRALGTLAAALLLPALPLILHSVWRVAYYGEPLPNTYYAKTGGGAAMWEQGLHGLAGFVGDPAHLPWLALAAAGLVLALRGPAKQRGAIVMAGAVILHWIYVVSVGDDGLRVHRFHVPVLAPLAYLAGLALGAEARWARKSAWLLTIATVAISQATFFGEQLPALKRGLSVYEEGNVKLGRRLRVTHPAETRIAVAAAGAIPYYSRLNAIDMYGLTDRRIARAPFPADRSSRMMKYDNADVLERSPDLIVINRGYFEAGDPLARQALRDPGIMAAGAMDRDLFRRVAADGRYALRALDLGDGSVFFVFERRDGWAP